MFDTTFNAKAGTITVFYADQDKVYVAVVTNAEGVQRLQDNDLAILFKQSLEVADHKLVAIAFRRFTQSVAQGLKELALQRKSFIEAAKPMFQKIASKAKSDKANESKSSKSKVEKAESKPVGVKASKTVVRKRPGS